MATNGNGVTLRMSDHCMTCSTGYCNPPHSILGLHKRTVFCRAVLSKQYDPKIHKYYPLLPGQLVVPSAAMATLVGLGLPTKILRRYGQLNRTTKLTLAA